MYFDFIGFNFYHPWLSNKNIRQALAMAYDAEAAVSRIYLNHALRTHSPVNPASWLYDPAVPVYEYDPETARQLLLQAQQEQFNLLIEQSFPLRILVNQENDERMLIAEGFSASMQGLGLETAVQALPFDDFVSKMEAGDYDIVVGCFYLDVIPDLTFAFHSSGNLFNFKDTDLDAMLAAVVTAPSENEHIRLLSEVQRHIAQEIPIISLVFRNSAIITDTRIQGELKPSPWYSLAGVNHWEINR
jgi:peptide/nickel transport system substrate-binding protein